MNCCNSKSAFATSQNDIVSDFLKIGETLFFTNDGWSRLVKVKYVSLVKASILKIVVTDTNRDNIVTTTEHLCSLSNPDIGWIPESTPEYGQAVKLLLEEAIEIITSPTHLYHCNKSF